MGRAVLLLFAADRALRRELRRWAYRRCASVLRAFGETRAAEILDRLSLDAPQPVADYGGTERTITGLPQQTLRPPAAPMQALYPRDHE